MNYEDVLEDFLNNYEEDSQQNLTMSVLEFRQSCYENVLTADDGSAYYLVGGEDTGISAFTNPQPFGCDGVVWYSK